MREELNELYQQTILDHSRHPKNFQPLPQANRSAEGNNPLCGDRFTVFLLVDKEVVADISFQGAGCAVSKAAASLMTETLKQKTVAESRQLAASFREMVKTGEGMMGELRTLAGVHLFPARIKCALLPWQAMLAALDGETKPVTTQEMA